MALSDDDVLPPIHATVTWVFFGLCAALLFYGIMLCQGHWYYRTYREDPVDLKIAVAAILFANAIYLGLVMHTCYYYMILNSLEPKAFDHALPSLVFTPFCIFLCIVLCDYVYIRRTYFSEISPLSLLGRFIGVPMIRKVIHEGYRWTFITSVIFAIGMATVFIMLLTVRLAKQPTLEHWLKIRWLASASFGFSVVNDLGLACILSLALHSSRTGLKRMDALLNTIIINAFRSGIFTSMLSILCLLVAVFEEKNIVILPLSLAVAKVCASATLVTLNVRRDLSEMLAGPGGSNLQAGDLTFFRFSPRQSERSQGDS